MHCRVAMMATIGYIIGESTPTIGYGMDVHHAIANNHLADLAVPLLLPLFLAINFAEAFRANKGWVNPTEGSLFTLRDSYYPGDLGFVSLTSHIFLLQVIAFSSHIPFIFSYIISRILLA